MDFDSRGGRTATAASSRTTATSAAPAGSAVMVTPAVAGGGTRTDSVAAGNKAAAVAVTVAAHAAVLVAVGDDSLSQRMSVDKNVIDELLLVCGVIGTAVSSSGEGGVDYSASASRDGGGGRSLRHHQQGELIVPVTDCLNWLQDLQRALRRDDDQYRPISLLLGDWKVVGQKLLPIVLSCRYDTSIVLTVCKILVILTKPLADNTVRAGRMVIDTKKMSPEVVRNQMKLRENALKQADMILEYKRIICHHSSHHHRCRHHNHRTKGEDSSDEEGEEGGGILSIFVSLLAEPLSKTGTARTDHDHLAIELVLHLFRNLLSAEPLLQSTAEQSYRDQQLHNELISLLEQELVLEILLVLSADLEARENAPYNLLVLELVHHLLRGQDPAAVAKGNAVERASIQQALAREQPRKSVLSSRHGHFGGTLAVTTAAGRHRYVSASRIGEKRLVAAPIVTKRKHKRTDPFVGGSTSGAAADRLSRQARGGPAQVKAWNVLDRFCNRFFNDCYGAVLKSWKNEFRRDSVRLQQDDLVVLMRIVWFFMLWRRVKGKNELGPLLFTMDLFTFNLVLTATDTYTERKKWSALATAIALLGEMMRWLHVMYSSTEQTEQIMALGLMDRLFYSNEPLDRLPRLFAKWEPGTTSRKCLGDLVELCYTTLKLLDANAKSCQDFAPSVEHKIQKKKDKNKKAQDTITKMKTAAADFDVNLYFARRLVSNQTVFMYTKLLSQYSSNSTQTNHRILAFLLRLSKFRIHLADPEAQQHHPLAAKTVTLEPMLHNVQVLLVMDRILNDQSIRKDKKFEPILSFATSFIHRLGRAAQENPLLFVEALFKHPVPHRFCDLATNMYVSEELRMLAERDLLLEEQRQLEDAGCDAEDGDSVNDGGGDDDSEEELEFEDFGITAPLKPTAKRRRLGGWSSDRNKAKGTVFDDSDDENIPPRGEPTETQTTEKKGVLDDNSYEEDELPAGSSPCAGPGRSDEAQEDKESGVMAPSMPEAIGTSKDPGSPKQSTFSADHESSDSSDAPPSPKIAHRRVTPRLQLSDDGSDSNDSESPPAEQSTTERIAYSNESGSESSNASESKRSVKKAGTSHSVMSDASNSESDDDPETLVNAAPHGELRGPKEKVDVPEDYESYLHETVSASSIERELSRNESDEPISSVKDKDVNSR